MAANDTAYRSSEPVEGTSLPPTNRSKPLSDRTNIAPWEDDPSIAPDESPPSDGKSASTTAHARQKPSARPTQLPSFSHNTFFDDSFDSQDAVSPGFVPHAATFPLHAQDERRPSAASATTVSSTGSKGSVGIKSQRKLQGFFGEDYLPSANDSRSRQNSDMSLVGVASRNRDNSRTDIFARDGPPSPMSSRPRSPGVSPPPDSEVTPWVFQDQSPFVSSV